MMNIEIRNIDVERVISFLEKEEMKGIKSINRSRLTNKLSEQLDSISKGEKVIREDFKDDEKGMVSELTDYFYQKITVDGSDMLTPLNVVKAHIIDLVSEDSDRIFKDEAAYTLSILYEAFNLGGEDE